MAKDDRREWIQTERFLAVEAPELRDLWERYWQALLDFTMQQPQSAGFLVQTIQEELQRIVAAHTAEETRQTTDESLT